MTGTKLEARDIASCLDAALADLQLSKEGVSQDIYNQIKSFLPASYAADLTVARGRTYLEQIVRVKGTMIMTVRVKKSFKTTPGYLYPHDVYGGFEVAMSGNLADNAKQS